MRTYMAAKAHCPEKFDEFREIAQKIGIRGLSVDADGQSWCWGDVDAEDKQWMEEV